MPHQTPQSSVTTVFQLNITPLPLAAPTTSSSASVILDLQATFVKYFGIDPATIDYTDREQKQVLSLLDRVLHNNPDSPVQKLCEGPDVIPFGLGLTIERAINLSQSGIPDKGKISLRRSIAEWREMPADFKSRGAFLIRTVNKIKHEITKDVLQSRQGPVALGKKYTNKTLVFDVVSKRYIEAEYTDKDHTHPWEKISQRVMDCIYAINTQPPDIARVLREAIVEKYPEYFQDKGKLIATELLKLTLYNDTDNLTMLNSPENSTKSDTAIITWLNKEENRGLCIQLLQLVATNSNGNLEDLIDQTGFIDRFKNNAAVKPEYRGRGIGLGIVSCFDRSVHEKLKEFEVRRLKNYELLNWLEFHVSEMKLKQLNVDDLKHLVQGFRDNFGKNNCKARNVAREKFIELAKSQTYTRFHSDSILALSSGSDTESESGKEIKRLTSDLTVSEAQTVKERQEKLEAQQRADHAQQRANHERQEKLEAQQRADHAQQRADHAVERANQERQRADKLAARLAELEASEGRNTETSTPHKRKSNEMN